MDATEGVEVVEDVEEDDCRGGIWTICGLEEVYVRTIEVDW